MRFNHLAISALLIACAAPAAMAEEPSVRISTADYRLDDPGQVAALHARIEAAAEEVCRDSILGSSPYFSRTLRTCIAHSTDQAVAMAGIPALSAFHVAEAAPTAGPRSETLAQR